MTLESSGTDERPFPFEFKEVLSLGTGTRFHSGDEEEVRKRLKEDCASLSALYHACLRLTRR